jgi:hypothetical protein
MVEEIVMSKPRRVDELKLKGRVTIYQGEGDEKEVIVNKAKNKWVDQGLKGLLSYLLGSFVRVNSGRAIYCWAYDFKTYLGRNTTTTTTHNLTALIDPIGSAPGTAPNRVSGKDRTNPATGTWHTAYIAVWDAGTVSGTVGEVALYLRPFTNITAQWILGPTNDYTFPLAMVSRCSVADGDFSPFTIDPSKSLTVYWEVQISYE